MIIMSKEDNVEKVLDVLDSEWKSTNTVRNKSGVNWYRTEDILKKLVKEGRVEKDMKPDTTYWRLSGEDNDD